MKCRYCDSSDIQLSRHYMLSGEFHLYYKCLSCTANALGPARWVKKVSIIPPCDLDTLPIGEDYRGLNPTCEVIGCSSKNTELHHWAPRAYFEDACELWPKSYLCTDHHQQWENKISVRLRTLTRREEARRE
jgi:hypothetical protein